MAISTDSTGQFTDVTANPEAPLNLTAESQDAYPGSTDPIVTQWTTDFKDAKLFRQELTGADVKVGVRSTEDRR